MMCTRPGPTKPMASASTQPSSQKWRSTADRGSPGLAAASPALHYRNVSQRVVACSRTGSSIVRLQNKWLAGAMFSFCKDYWQTQPWMAVTCAAESLTGIFLQYRTIDESGTRNTIILVERSCFVADHFAPVARWQHW